VNEHIGISRGGKNTKVHAAVDALGYPLHVVLSGGNLGFVHMCCALIWLK
jgi:hypothetical protein